ncbi:ABC transporter substrate-binding protein [Brucellaceae bacterium C25G]
MKKQILALMAGVMLGVSGVSAVCAEEFDLDALIEAARKEEPINVYDSTGRIVEMADNFTKLYGVKAVGQKVKATAQLEMIIREAQSGNVRGDVSIISDVPAAVAQLIPMKFAFSWMPEDLKNDVPEQFQDPLIVVNSANVLAYNTKLYDKCPITNIWQLTEPEWKGKLAMQDPLGKPSYTDWFNQMRSYNDDAIKAAYEKHYGKPLESKFDSATEAWVAAVAANSPLLTDADAAAAQAVAAPGQKDPFVGIIASAKFRDNDQGGYSLGLCHGIDPFIGFMNSGAGMIMTGSNSPNAAKLFMRYVMTAEGIAPQADDGKISTNKTVKLPADEPSGIGAYVDQVLSYNPASALEDWDERQDWQDFWRLNYKK